MRTGWRRWTTGRFGRRSAPTADGSPGLDAIRALGFTPVRVSRRARLRQHARLVRTRWRLAIAVAAAAMLVAAVACLCTTPRYTATAVVLVRSDGRPPAAGQPPSVDELGYFAREIAVLDGRSLAAEVIRTLGLERDPRFVAAAQPPGLLRRAASALHSRFRRREPTADDDADEVDDTDDAGVAADVPPALVRAYRNAFALRPMRRTGQAEIGFTSPSAALAQQIATAHATAYLRRSLQTRFAPTGAARALLEHEAERSRDERTAAAAALAAFGGAHRDLVPTPQEEETRARLADLARRLGEAQAARISAEADDRLVKQRAYDALPAIAADPVIRTLRADVERLRARQASLDESASAGGALRDAVTELRQAKTRLDRELRRALAGIESTFLDAQGREAGLRAQLEREQAALDPASLVSQSIRLQVAAISTEATDTKLRARIEDSATAGAPPDASSLEPAALPQSPSEPHVWRALAAGALLGVLLGALAAILVPTTSARIGTPDDVRRLLRIPTLGVVPDFARVERPGSAPEAYRSLRTSVLFLSPERPPRTLLVTSSQAGDGKTATTVNLGLSLAAVGMRVAVIDAAFGDPAVHRAVDAPPGPGLGELLTGDAKLDKCLRTIPVDGGGTLGVIAAGVAGAAPADALASPRTRTLLDTLAERFDLVLIDAPPVLPSGAQGALLAPLFDGVLLVVPAGAADPAVVQEALARLRATKSRLVGVVLNRVDPAAGYYRTYAYPFAA